MLYNITYLYYVFVILYCEVMATHLIEPESELIAFRANIQAEIDVLRNAGTSAKGIIKVLRLFANIFEGYPDYQDAVNEAILNFKKNVLSPYMDKGWVYYNEDVGFGLSKIAKEELGIIPYIEIQDIIDL